MSRALVTTAEARLGLAGLCLAAASPRHVAKIMEGDNTLGRIISAFLPEMADFGRQAMFECVESKCDYELA